jgi:non-specific riboncleoside hydrolase
MYDVISQHADGEVILVATGSLTNVALLLIVFPEVKAKLSQIVLMGGAMGIGNTGPVAEFNIQVRTSRMRHVNAHCIYILSHLLLV